MPWTESLTRGCGSITLEWWTGPSRRAGRRTSWWWPRRAETARRSGCSTSGSGRWSTACCSPGCRTARWTTSCRTSSSRRSSGCRRCARRARSVRGWRRSPATAPSIITAVRRPSRLPDDIPAADDAAAGRGARRAVRRSSRCPPRTARPWCSGSSKGMTGQEIADRTGLTPASVRVNLHRGMKRLREALRLEARGPMSDKYLWDRIRRARPGRRAPGTPARRAPPPFRPARLHAPAGVHSSPPDRAGDGGGSSWRPPPAPRW